MLLGLPSSWMVDDATFLLAPLRSTSSAGGRCRLFKFQPEVASFRISRTALNEIAISANGGQPTQVWRLRFTLSCGNDKAKHVICQARHGADLVGWDEVWID